MAIVRNMSVGALLIGGTRPVHLLPGRAISVTDAQMKLPQMRNLINRGLLKTVNIVRKRKPEPEPAKEKPAEEVKAKKTGEEVKAKEANEGELTEKGKEEKEEEKATEGKKKGK